MGRTPAVQRPRDGSPYPHNLLRVSRYDNVGRLPESCPLRA